MEHRKPAPPLLPNVGMDVQVLSLNHCQAGHALQLLKLEQARLSQLPAGSEQLTFREELYFCGVEVEVTSTGVLGVGAVGHHRP